jgi:hypothetical protein
MGTITPLPLASHVRSDAPGDSVPRIAEMMLRWQIWAPERTAYVRCFDSSAAPAAFPEFPEVSELAPGMEVFVIYNVDDGSPMKLRGRLADVAPG